MGVLNKKLLMALDISIGLGATAEGFRSGRDIGVNFEYIRKSKNA